MSATTALPPRLTARIIPGAIAVILGGAMLAAIAARLTGYATPPALPSVIASESLSFTDLPNGGVAVRNAATGALIADVAARNDGFLRMTLRLMAGTRARNNIGATQPFRLTEYQGGRMELADPATGLVIELEAFGPSNIGEFAKFLTPEAQP